MPDIPINMTVAGAIPRDAEEIRQSNYDGIAEINPDLAAFLPGSPQNAFSDTSVIPQSDCERMFVDLINSITPYAANEAILNQWGYLFGIERGLPTRPAVFVRFTGTVGFVISKDFIVSDGTHQYQAAHGGIVNATGFVMIYCIATVDGSWAIPENTVIQIVSSVYSPVVLACTNPIDGTAGTGEEILSAFRARNVTALQRTSTGITAYAKNLLYRVVGSQRLVSVKQSNFAVKVIAGSGDPYEIADAIFKSGLDVSRLLGSSIDENRNIVVSIDNYPDVYNVLFINPPAQTAEITATWNTNNPNFVSDAAISAFVKTAINEYINSLPIGYKINVMELQRVFEDAVSTVIDRQFLSKIDFVVKIDGIVQLPDGGGELISGDFEGYFITDESKIIVQRG